MPERSLMNVLVGCCFAAACTATIVTVAVAEPASATPSADFHTL